MTNPGDSVLHANDEHGIAASAGSALVASAGQPATPQAGGTALAAPAGETSTIGRGVTLLTPVFAIAAGWLAGVVAKVVPGAHLDRAQITTFMVAAATAALTAAWKWLQGWQQHERLVAAGQASPVGKPK